MPDPLTQAVMQRQAAQPAPVEQNRALFAQLLQGRMQRPAMSPGLMELGAGMVPGVGDAMAARDALSAGQRFSGALRAGDWGGAASAGLESVGNWLGALPMVPGFMGAIKAYHATGKAFDDFDMKRAGTGMSTGTKERAIFLSDNPEVADSYLGSVFVDTGSPAIQQQTGMKETADRIGKYYTEGSNVRPVFIESADDFDVWDMGGGGYTPEFMRDALKEARKSGAKGVKFENVRDPGLMSTGRPKPSTVYAVFDPKLLRPGFGSAE